MSLQIKSTAFESGQFIAKKYTCDGDNINPPLEFSNVPEKTESLALVVNSPEVPSKDFIHWFVWSIGANVRSVAENSVPKDGIVAENDFRRRDYRGPCPPSGTVHKYQFKLYALDAKIKLPPSAKKHEIQRMMHGHIIEHAVLSAVYKKA